MAKNWAADRYNTGRPWVTKEQPCRHCGTAKWISYFPHSPGRIREHDTWREALEWALSYRTNP